MSKEYLNKTGSQDYSILPFIKETQTYYKMHYEIHTVQSFST